MNNSCGLQLSPSRFQLRFQSLVLLYSMRRSHFFTRSTETSEGVPRFTIGHFSGYPSLSALANVSQKEHHSSQYHYAQIVDRAVQEKLHMVCV